MIKRIVAMLLCAALAESGCAAAAMDANDLAPQREVLAPHAETAAIASYAQKLPVGSRVKVERLSGGAIKGTLIKASDEAIVVQRNTRVPEPPVEIRIADVTRVTLDSNNHTGRNIALGIAAGVGAAFAVLGILAVLIND
jgi:hypothetical protein